MPHAILGSMKLVQGHTASEIAALGFGFRPSSLVAGKR